MAEQSRQQSFSHDDYVQIYVLEEKADQHKIKAESDTKEKADKIKKVCRIRMRPANKNYFANEVLTL